jgi:hypothetical protein
MVTTLPTMTTLPSGLTAAAVTEGVGSLPDGEGRSLAVAQLPAMIEAASATASGP